jgi:hypothetical protein
MSTPGRRSRTRRSDAQWLELLEQQRGSGLTQKAFCEHHGIVVGGFRSAMRRLAEKPRSALTHVESSFVEVGLADMPAPARWDVELCLGEGVVIRLRKS